MLDALRTPFLRWLKFNAVGAMGTGVQLVMLALLLRILTPHFIWATALAVETAVLHNFFWHWGWTWADRRPHGMAVALLRFNLSNGLISLSGTLLCTVILTGLVHMNPLLANVLAFLPCWFINYLVSDRLVFASPIGGDPIGEQTI